MLLAHLLSSHIYQQATGKTELLCKQDISKVEIGELAIFLDINRNIAVEISEVLQQEL